MDRHAIITLPHKSLRQRSVRVGFVTDDIIKLVERMKAATLDWEAHKQHEIGVALAAIQINELYRVIIIRSDLNDKQSTEFDVFINPEIVKYEGEVVEDYEGCLSVRGVYGKVPRHSKVRVAARDISGKSIRLKAEGFLARVFQHEIDHTNGKLFVDIIRDKPDAFYTLNDSGKIEAIDEKERDRIFRILW